MGKRKPPTHLKRLGRELAMQFLFQVDMQAMENPEKALEYFWKQADASGAFPDIRKFNKAIVFAERIIGGVLENLDKIDAKISGVAEKWEFSRIAVVDRNVMRVATFEMLYCPDIPPVVSIDEAVEIARDFSSEKSGLFINGVLNAIMATLDRPARTPVDKL